MERPKVKYQTIAMRTMTYAEWKKRDHVFQNIIHGRIINILDEFSKNLGKYFRPKL